MRPLPRLFPLACSDGSAPHILVISQEWPDVENARLLLDYNDKQTIISVWELLDDRCWRVTVGPWSAGPRSIQVTKAYIAFSGELGAIEYDPLAELPEVATKALEFEINRGHGMTKLANGSWDLAVHLGWRDYLVTVNKPYPTEVHHEETG